jgi:hypothetical protein
VLLKLFVSTVLRDEQFEECGRDEQIEEYGRDEHLEEYGIDEQFDEYVETNSLRNTVE